MYSTRSGLILGFHGTDKSIVKGVISGKKPLTHRENAYDWLGHGLYFWEHSPSRALDFANLLQQNPTRSKIEIKTPAVLGAVINLGKCLDLTDFKNLQLLKLGFESIEKTLGGKYPVNKSVGGGKDLLLRELDCLVIETLHRIVGQDTFDSVRGVFWEGDELYPTAGFKEKNHIQICIRNPNCIKGYFQERDKTKGYKMV